MLVLTQRAGAQDDAGPSEVASASDSALAPATDAAANDDASAESEAVAADDAGTAADSAAVSAADASDTVPVARARPPVSAEGPCVGTSSPAAARVCEGLALAAARRWAQAERALESALELSDAMVEARREQLEAALAQARAQLGSLEVRSYPEGARISIDGVLAGTTPLDRPLRLLPGEHLVRGTLANHDAREEVAVVTAGELTLAELQLEARDDRPVLEQMGDAGEAQRVVGLVALSLGIIGLSVGVGTLIGGLAGMPDDVNLLLDISRGMLIAGGVLFVGGIVLALTA